MSWTVTTKDNTDETWTDAETTTTNTWTVDT